MFLNIQIDLLIILWAIYFNNQKIIYENFLR